MSSLEGFLKHFYFLEVNSYYLLELINCKYDGAGWIPHIMNYHIEEYLVGMELLFEHLHLFFQNHFSKHTHLIWIAVELKEIIGDDLRADFFEGNF